MQKLFGCVAMGALCLAGSMAFAADQASFYVSPSGSDSNKGTLESPFKTISKAQKAVREINGTMTGDIVVYLREGTYQLAAPINFTEADGGKDGHYVRYKAYENEKPLITGGKPVTGWTIHDEANNIWKAEGVDGVFRQLYVNNKKAIRACYPNMVQAEDNPDLMDHDFKRLTVVDSVGRAFDVSTDDVKMIKNADNVEIHLMIAWSENILRLEKIENNGGTSKLIPKDPERTKLFHRAFPMLGTAFMSNPPKQQVYYLENSYDLIDAPGEWFLDEKEHVLYYKAREGENMATANVVAPNINTLFNVLGPDTKTKVGYMAFEGLYFAHSNYTRPSEEGFLDLQAGNFNVDVLPDPERGNWEKLNSNKYLLWRPDAAFRVENAHHFLVQGCVFAQIAATGLDFVSGTNDDLIQGNTFFDIGAAGIMIGKFYQDSTTEIHIAYNPSDKEEISTRDTIKNNYLTRTTNEHQGAVAIGAGYPRFVEISHNEISYTYYSGISVGFGWTKQETAMTNNKINWNNIHHISRLLCDSGPIYTLSNQGTGSEIQYNYMHDYGTSKWSDYWVLPIYLDEGSSGFTVRENVYRNSPDGIGQNQPGTNSISQDGGYWNAETAANAGIEKDFQSITSINEIPLADFSAPVPQAPFKEGLAIPGVIQAEDYDEGGQGVSYSDKDFVNEGGFYREDGVDIVLLDTLDESKGYAVGHTNAGEWLEYTFNMVESSKVYFRANVASGLEGAGFIFSVDGKAVTDTVKIPAGEDWNTYATIDGAFSDGVTAGEHVLRVTFTGPYGNVDWFRFASTKEGLDAVDTTTTVQPVPGDSNPGTDKMVSYNVVFPKSNVYNVFDISGKHVANVSMMGAPTADLLMRTMRNSGLKAGCYYVRNPSLKFGKLVQLNK